MTTDTVPKIINGIDVSALTHEKPSKSIPMVAGRTVHIDGDFIAYMVAYDDTKGLEAMKHNTDMKIEKIIGMSGAEHYVVHLTHKDSDKGQRHNLAMLKQYQLSRKKVKPKYLHLIRAYMHDQHNGLNHLDKEADDGMSIAQYAAIAAGNRNLSVIATKDKDLLMVPGLQLDWENGGISDTKEDFGEIVLDKSGSATKVRGRGWKMFWAQMLMGDAVDTISGLPKVYDAKYLPTGKPKACGPVMAYEILGPITNNKEAFETVRDLFKKCHEAEPFKNYRTGEEITAGEAFLSEAKLLWMRRNNDQDDILHWLKETCV